MIKTIKDEIIKLLNTLEGFKGVYGYPQNNPTGYPYCYVVWEDNEAEVLTNREDRIAVKFIITTVQEKVEELKGKAKAEATTINRAWAIESLFRDNNDLGITNVLRVLPTRSVKKYDATADRIILETEVVVQAIAEVST